MYTAQTKHILIFNIAPVSPTIHFYRQNVFTYVYKRSYIKFRIIVSPLTITDFTPIYPNIHTTINSIKMKKDFLTIPIFWYLKITTI